MAGRDALVVLRVRRVRVDPKLRAEGLAERGGGQEDKSGGGEPDTFSSSTPAVM